ncbi:MAG: arginine--tRNA ligase [Thermoleophilia bacterium]|nr:arginine--tRNA ligase [Thermoleophilia bacterium]
MRSPEAIRQLVEPIEVALRSLGAEQGIEVELERPKDAAHGDFATTVALQLAPALRRKPRELAEALAATADFGGLVEAVDVAGPGFLNLRVSTAWVTTALGELLAAGDRYGAGSAVRPERIQVELVSANPTGPLHIGGARNGAYGDAVARLLEFAGHTVEREYYYNDAGRQMERFRASVEAHRRGEEPPEDGYHGAYVGELAAVPGDPVPRMLERIEASLERFRIHVDTWARQSELELRIPELLEGLDTYEAEGATWLRASAHGAEKDYVLIRSPERGGLPTYEAADAVYLHDKFSRGFDRLVYVLGADHHGHVQYLRTTASALGYDPDRVEVLLYQLVHLTEGKMSKRAGNIVFLDDLLDQIGVDAARWYLVNRGHDQTIEIDVDLARERSEKNPVYYVQYAHARIAGILRNAAEVEPEAAPPHAPAPEERELLKRLVEFPGLVAEATERRGPHAVPVYAVRLADEFHRFYHHHRVLGSDAEGFRLALCRSTKAVIARCLDLVGVEAPERM